MKKVKAIAICFAMVLALSVPVSAQSEAITQTNGNWYHFNGGGACGPPGFCRP